MAFKPTKIELTIEVEALLPSGEWQAVIKTGATILWRSKHKPLATEAFRVAAKLVGDMPTDFFWAADRSAPVDTNACDRYLKNIER